MDHELSLFSEKPRTLRTLEGDYIQSNPLIEARKHMDTIETRLFSLAVKDIRPHISENDYDYDKIFPILRIPPSNLEAIFGNGWYMTAIKEKCKKLFETSIMIELKGGFRLRHIFRKMDYIDGMGLYIQFDEDMRPFLLDLVGQQFTKIPMQRIFKLTSPYAWRLMEIMLRFYGTGKNILTRKMTVEDLRFALDVPDTAYSRMTDFKKNVLDNPIKEINKKTDYEMSYESLKQGRKIVGFLFRLDVSKIRDDKYTEQIDAEVVYEVPEKSDINRMVAYGLSEKDARFFLKNEGRDYCTKQMDYVESMKRKGKIKNLGGYLKTALQNDYAGQKELADFSRQREEQARRENEEWDKAAKDFFLETTDEETQKKKDALRAVLKDKILNKEIEYSDYMRLWKEGLKKIEG